MAGKLLVTVPCGSFASKVKTKINFLSSPQKAYQLHIAIIMCGTGMLVVAPCIVTIKSKRRQKLVYFVYFTCMKGDASA